MGRLFDLDLQLIHDAILLSISMLVMFAFLSYMFFNPIRSYLKKRQDKIKSNLDIAASEKTDALNLKKKYEQKLKDADAETEELLKQARISALKYQDQILIEAKAEAHLIIKRARAEIELERSNAADQVKREIVSIAAVMAAKVVGDSISIRIQDALIEKTIEDMGGQKWLD